jgi:hypothetical protein
MIRYAYICSQILQIYRTMDKIRFPITPRSLIAQVPNCRVMSYQKFAEINNCKLDDVIQICESKTGCTHYDTTKNRYLILLNESSSGNNVPGRKIWTEGHESVMLSLPKPIAPFRNLQRTALIICLWMSLKLRPIILPQCFFALCPFVNFLI